MDKSEKEKPCPEQGTGDEREVSSSNLSSGAKRKIDFVLSPTLVEKVKTRTNRQPSKVCKSPYIGTKQNRVSTTKTNCPNVGDITKGLELSDLELHAIKYILEEFATEPNKI